jgi:trigger factor
LEAAIEDSYRDAMKQLGLLPVGSPAVENVKFPQGGVLSFDATFEIRPAVNLKNYKGLKIKKKLEVVKDEDVDKSLESLRQLGTQYKTVPARPVKEGDFVLSDMIWFVENMPVDKREKVLLPVEKNTLTPDVFSGILGSVVGEKKSIPVNIDKNFPKQEYVGKSAILEITVHEIKEKELPVLDDDFAKDLGIPEGIKVLREKVKDRLKLEKQEAVRLDMQDQIINQLLKSHSFDLPLSLVESEFQNLLEESKHKLLHQGYTKEQAEEIFQKEKENLTKSLKPHAENQVKTFFIIEDIAEKEKVSVSEEELNQFIEALAVRQGQKDVASFRRQLEKEQRLNGIYWQLTEAKVMQLLTDNAKIEEEAGNV